MTTDSVVHDRCTNRKAYGERIRQARVNVMMSRRTLAYLLHIAEETVARWESGEYQPLGGDLDRLVEIFKHPREFYFKEPAEHFDRSRIFFRERSDG